MAAPKEQTCRLVTDASSVEAFLREADDLSKSFPAEVREAVFRRSIDRINGLAIVHDPAATARTGDIVLCIQLPQRADDLLAALRAGECDFGVPVGIPAAQLTG